MSAGSSTQPKVATQPKVNFGESDKTAQHQNEPNSTASVPATVQTTHNPEKDLIS